MTSGDWERVVGIAGLLQNGCRELAAWLDTLPAETRRNAPGGVMWLAYVAFAKTPDEGLPFDPICP